MPNTPREQIDAIYFLFETGKRQRDLIIAVAKATFKPDKQNRPHRTTKQIGRLISKTEILAPKRNAAIYANLFIHPTVEGQASYRIMAGNPFRPNPLFGKDVEKELRQSLFEIQRLVKDLEDFRLAMIPKREVPPELIEALRKHNLHIPRWMIARQTTPSGQEES
jgi:hypothetical protein